MPAVLPRRYTFSPISMVSISRAARRFQDLEGGRHDFGADAVAVRNGDRGFGGHREIPRYMECGGWRKLRLARGGDGAEPRA